MRRFFILGLLFFPFVLLAQSKVKSKKYPSLLWEITGNGLSKPSYLFGTMHVSSKLAFHLADSFFLGIRNADVVALETNPESWQEDMSKYESGSNTIRGYSGSADYVEAPDEYLRLSTLEFYKYDKKIERALYSNPSAINNLLYRSYGNETSDFEEDTYLDMYIYQCGKRWGKKVAGVEKYAESMKLMLEAYKDAARDRVTKERSFDSENSYSFNKLQEAYRSGNLDWLDSINKYNSFSPSFDEKFLYRRNEIQASSIDSILRSGQSLFVGVGAAHLPGTRGVIEILRDEGYKLRPIKMGARDSQHKNLVENVRVPVKFTTQEANDGLYKVDIPGRFYKFGEDGSLDQRQYADMANGSYYMVTRILTNGWMWGHSTQKIYNVIDSLLYENIPGRIIRKTKITRNGYKGIDLTNRTRRGDVQRYNIFVTPFEVVIFKMSGTGDYVDKGDEAKRFFESIRLKEYTAVTEQPSIWTHYSPPYGGFAIDLPHDPHISNDGSWIFDAVDKATQTNFRVIRTDIHNYNFAEEDSFDLALMAESFEASEFIGKPESRKFTRHRGYPALDCRYKGKNGGFFVTRFIIQGPHYYSLIGYSKKETPIIQKFLGSFEIQPYRYGTAEQKKDTSLYYTVNTPVFPGISADKLDLPRYNYGDDDDMTGDASLENGVFRSKIVENDSTGEKIYVSFFKMQRYRQILDSARLQQHNNTFFDDSTGIIRLKKKEELPGGAMVWETVVSDTGSSRTVWSKTFFKNGIGYSIFTESDTLSKPSTFITSFFDSFVPSDSLTGLDPLTKKSGLFFEDFKSTDSVAHNRAVKNINVVHLDSGDLPQLKNAINSLGWKEKKYLEVKKDLLGKMGNMKIPAASDYLRNIYYAAGDTVELQYKALATLLRQQTAYSYMVFSGIMENDPPVLDAGSGNSNEVDRVYQRNMRSFQRPAGNRHSDFLDDLNDSLKLTMTILPRLLPLINIDEYKNSIMYLLAQMIDSNLIEARDYEIYFTKFLVEAKHEMKRQSIAEKKMAIAKAEQIKQQKNNGGSRSDDEDDDNTNEKLRLYTVLLMPHWDTKPAVRTLFSQVLNTSDRRLKYNTMLLLIKNEKPYNDSLLKYFASVDAFRYDLYTDLKTLGKENLFPASFNNHIALAKSQLLSEKSYDKPDSLVYVDRMPATIKSKKGFVYFFKYKKKKDDAGWKLASAGLVPEDPRVFSFEAKPVTGNEYSIYRRQSPDAYDLTGFSNTKLNDDDPLSEQLGKELRRLVYSHRKSAREFYEKPDGNYYSEFRINYDED